MATTAPGHGLITDRQGRLTLTVIDDRTLLTTSAVNASTLTPVSRLTTADATNKTKVDQVIEIGTNGIVGGVVDLGEFTGKLTRQATSTKLLGLITAQKQNPVAGQTTTWNYFSYGAARFDYARLLADAAGTIYGFWAAMDCILTKAEYSTKNQSMMTEDYDVKGPQLAYFNGYPVCKSYVIQAADVTAGMVPISSTFFGSLNTNTVGAEIPQRKLPPTVGNPPDSLYDSGRVNFLKLNRVPSSQATIGGVSYSAGSQVRYRELQDYKVVGSSLATAGAQASLTTTVFSPASAAVINYCGPELVVGASIIVDPGAANQEVCAITAVTGSTISFTTTKTHSATGCTIALNPPSGYAVYNSLTGALVLGDALVATDVIRVMFSSYDTASMGKTISTTKFDTTDAAGIPARLTPITINNQTYVGIQDATITITIDRKQVQGVGENEIRYGTAGVPDIAYQVSVMPLDNSLIENLTTGASGNGVGGDIYSMDYMARYMNTNALPFSISVKSPTGNQKILFSVTGNQPVFDSQDETGAATAELTQKFSGKDLSGQITISATT